MSDFEFPTEKRFSRLTSARAELINARFSEVATASATKVDKTGGSVTGALSVSGNFSVGGTFAVTGNATFGGTLAVTGAVTLSAALTLPGNPTSDLQAAPKQYVDAGDAAVSAAKLSLSGGTMSGAIAMGGNKITGAGAPTDAGDYATKAYADGLAFSSALPGQAGNAGKFITTNGTTASWAEVYPTQTGNAGKVLGTDGTNTSWVAGAGARPFTATGTLPNGATVVLNSDGTVSTVTSNPDTTGTATVFRSATSTYIASAALSATQVVVCYYDGANAQAVIGTISGTSVSFGSAVSFVTGIATSYISVAALSSSSFVVAFTTGAPNHAQARVGSVSGTTITFPTAAAAFNAASTAHIYIAALSSTAVVIAYQDTGNSSYGTAIIGTISGTTITFGSEYVFSSAGGATTAVSVAALSSGSAVFTFQYGSNGGCLVGSISGTVINFGSRVDFDASGSGVPYTSVVPLTSNTFMVAWARSTTDGRAKIGTTAGNSISFTGASDVLFNTGNTAYISATKLSSASVAVVYRDDGNSSYGTLVVGTVSGLGILFGSEIVFRSANSPHIGACTIGSNVFIGYYDGGNSNYGTGVVFQPAATNVADWQGITAAAIANGASGLVTVRGGRATNLSGLTTKATYYLSNDGTLTTTATNFKVGVALSATELEIRGNA